MAKHISNRPDWLKAGRVTDIYSVSHCISSGFADYVKYWKHNGYWFFDSPEIIRELAREHGLDLSQTTLFYYEVHEYEYHDKEGWKPFAPEPSFITRVIEPEIKHLEGYDIVTFSAGTSPECSPLSCNSMATEVETNQHCLLSSFELAQQTLEQGKLKNTEPGPFRIFAIYSV
ncbi:MAG TPA: hypothetical protein VIH66_03220 [Gammaproteobacteria bacterium]